MKAKMEHRENHKAEKDHQEIKAVKPGLVSGNIAKPTARKLHHPEDGPDVHQRNCGVQAEEDGLELHHTLVKCWQQMTVQHSLLLLLQQMIIKAQHVESRLSSTA